MALVPDLTWRMIILEMQMKTTPCQPSSEIDVLITETRSQQCPLISVKQAAQRLGVSTSTVYRISRQHGPFRFVLDGHRIFIDLASFDAHLVNVEGIRADHGPLIFEGERACPRSMKEPEEQSQTDELPNKSFATETLGVSIPATTSGGQRELIMQQYHRPYIVLYVS